MLDFVVIFTKGGIVLWMTDNRAVEDFSVCINNLIRSVIMEDKNMNSKHCEDENLSVQFKLDNDFQLVYAVIFQKVINLNYIDTFLNNTQLAFNQKFARLLLTGNVNIEFKFDKEFQNLLATVESSARLNTAPKQMRSYKESLKSKKNIASMMLDDSRHISAGVFGKCVSLSSAPVSSGVVSTLSGIDIIQENRRKLKEKLSGNKKVSPTESKKSRHAEKTIKKPRIWDLGGNSKDAALLDRSKATRENDQYHNVHTDLIGTMQGGIRDIEIESDGDVESDNSRNVNIKSGNLLSYFKRIVGVKTITRNGLQPMLDKMRDHLISKNVAIDIAHKLCDSVAVNLEGRTLGTFDSVANLVKDTLTESLLRILTPKRRIDILRDALESKNNNKPYTIIFCGVNGVGKSTNLAKVCFWLIENDFSVLIAACDTFRAGAVEQLRTHTRYLTSLHPSSKHNNRTMVQLYEKGYGKDAAGIAMEAIRYACDKNFDVVLVDTAGRMQDNEPLMRSLCKLIKINVPDLVLFVGEALVGNEAVDQLIKFNQSLADYSSDQKPHIIDGIILTKFDTIDDKVGAAISMTYITGQPIVFVGTGQTYSDLKAINVNAVVHSLMK